MDSTLRFRAEIRRCSDQYILDLEKILQEEKARRYDIEKASKQATGTPGG
jgi:hypothetical protein